MWDDLEREVLEEFGALAPPSSGEVASVTELGSWTSWGCAKSGEAMRLRMRALRAERARLRVCRDCGGRLAPGSSYRCAEHLERVRLSITRECSHLRCRRRVSKSSRWKLCAACRRRGRKRR